MHYSFHNRLLSLDVRSKTLAYAVFEDCTQLLDFSVSGATRMDFQATRVERLVRRFQPDVIVLRKISTGSTRDTVASRAAVKTIHSTARRFSVPVACIGKRQLAETFGRHCKTTKYRIAVLLASGFPALTWYLPSRRKIYNPEDRRMQYFDAAAAGLAYFAANGDAVAVQQFLSKAESFRRPLTSGV